MEHQIPIAWKNIETVFLDMDGTLLDLHFDNHFWLEHMPKRYAENNNIPFQEASDILMQHSENTQGSLNWYCLDHWTKELNLDVVTLKHEVADKISIRENVIEFLTHIKNLKKRVVLLTNAHRKSCELKFSYVDIESYFDEVITSHDIGLAKEELGFWEALGKHDSFNKDNSLFIDDNFDVLNNAKKFGIKYLLTISKPDSQQPIKTSQDYIAIDNYNQLILSS